MTEPGWLNREFKSIKEDSKNWPSWMKQDGNDRGARTDSTQSSKAVDRSTEGKVGRTNAMLGDDVPDQIVRRIAWMQEHGSSVLLNWGEDDGLWECSWITGGVRHVGYSQFLELAIDAAMEKAGVTIDDAG